MQKQMQAFLSHIKEEAELARTIQQALENDFLRLIQVFVSSDPECIGAGREWRDSIKDALGKSDLFIVLCSPASIERPWINFEAGAAWIREIPLVPLCHSGLSPQNLPAQLSQLQAFSLERPNALVPLYKLVADIIGCAPPKPSYDDLTIKLAADESTIKPADGKMRDRDAKPAAKQKPPQSLDEILSMVRNKALASFVETEVATGLPFRGRTRLLYYIGGRARFNFNITRKWATIWQPSRFREDINFWTSLLGEDAQVKEVNDGACLTFKLTTAEHFKNFKRAVAEEIKPEWFAQMAGTEDSWEFTVVVSTKRGRLGYRMLQGSNSCRIRVEPSSEGTLSLAQLLTRDRGWKQPGDDNQDRFSSVVSREQLVAVLSFAIRALKPKATEQWIARKVAETTRLPVKGGDERDGNTEP